MKLYCALFTLATAIPAVSASFLTGFLFTQLHTDQISQVIGNDLVGPNAASDCKTEYKIDGAECGELCIASSIASLAEKFGGVSPGACSDEGYTVFDHEETVSMGPLGESTVTIYTKP